jgi:tetratricopeptide (TPR) repeat protein
VVRIVGRYPEALEALDRAADLYKQADDHEGEAQALREISWAHNYSGTLDRGVARVQSVIDRLERLPEATVSPRALADLYTGLAICLWPGARYSEVLAAAEKAGAMSRAASVTRTLCVAETLRGLALAMVGPLPEARRVLKEAIALFDVDGHPWWLAQPWAYLGLAHVDEGNLQSGLRCLEHARKLIEATHDPAELTWITGCIGESSFLRGNWADARSIYEAAIRLAREVRSDRYLSYILLHRADLWLAEGNWEEALRDVHEALEVASRCPAAPALRKAPRLLAEKEVVEGRPRSAIDRLEPLLDQSAGEWPGSFPPPVLAEAYLQAGDVASARDLVHRRVQRLQAQNRRRALPLWLRIQGMILDRQKQWEEADRVFAEAVSLAQAMLYPYAKAHCLYEWGISYIHRGESVEASRRLQEALSVFERLGAALFAQRTQRALRDLDEG